MTHPFAPPLPQSPALPKKWTPKELETKPHSPASHTPGELALSSPATSPATPIRTNAYDSVADLKRSLQAQYGTDWGLSTRRKDHERLAIGWELVHKGSVLCPNYLIRDYGVETGDLVHAVIRREGTS